MAIDVWKGQGDVQLSREEFARRIPVARGPIPPMQPSSEPRAK